MMLLLSGDEVCFSYRTPRFSVKPRRTSQSSCPNRSTFTYERSMPAKSYGAKSRWSEVGRRGSVKPWVNRIGNVAGLLGLNGYGVPAANVYTATASALNTPVFA